MQNFSTFSATIESLTALGTALVRHDALQFSGMEVLVKNYNITISEVIPVWSIAGQAAARRTGSGEKEQSCIYIYFIVVI